MLIYLNVRVIMKSEIDIDISVFGSNKNFEVYDMINVILIVGTVT